MINVITPVACVIMAGITPVCIDDYLSGNSYVKSSASYVESDIAVVAILTKPIFTQSEREKLLKGVAKDLYERFDLTKVIVTPDSEIFCNIELGTANMDKLLRMLKQRGGSYEYTGDN